MIPLFVLSPVIVKWNNLIKFDYNFLWKRICKKVFPRVHDIDNVRAEHSTTAMSWLCWSLPSS